jgi:hypothetical protein
MSLSATRIIQYQRLQTPEAHLGVLIEPPAPGLIAALGAGPGASFQDPRLLDTTLGELRRQLRQRLGLAGLVVLTGHQPEFVHAGVLAKSIAADALSSRLGAQAAFLMVDSDVPKTTQLALPQSTSRGLRRVEVPVPGCDRQYPFEHQPAAPRAEWLQFFAMLTSLHDFGDRSLLPTFARAWLTTGDANPRYCDAMARAQAAAEAALGLGVLWQLRMSQLCQTPEFRVFVAALLLDAGRCAKQYNAAQAAYRERHRVRAPGRPAPPLLVRDELVELPFWAVRPDEPRRRLFVTRIHDAVELSTDNRVIGDLRPADLARAATHQAPWPIEQAGWQLRPRALALSAFARLFVADLFIHGIGGARYDEMMEDFAARFFGVAPMPAGCVSATLRLPLAHSGVSRMDIAAARHQSRDLRYNPQRHLTNLPGELIHRRAELIRRGIELRAHQCWDHAGRRLVFREIRRTNGQMLESDPWRAAEYDQRVQTLESQWQLDRIALDREYFYALHLPQMLEQLVQVIRKEIGTG